MTQTPVATSALPAGVNQITLWNDDDPCVPCAPGLTPADYALRWVDVHPGATVEQVVVALEPFCPDVTAAHARALLEPGGEERATPTGTRVFEDGARMTCAFGARALREPREEDPDGVQVAGWLAFKPVSILVCGPLIATCWHDARWFRGQQESEPPAALVGLAEEEFDGFATCLAAVDRRWHEEQLGCTAADLGVLLIFEQALSYGPASRAVSNWLEDFELELYNRHSVDEDDLQELWGSMAILRDWVGRLNRPGIDDDIDKAWFRGASDHAQVRATDTKIDRSLSTLGDLATTLRAAFAMQHARLEARERDRREDRQRRVEYIAALFLMPTLIVGFFGANVTLPGGGTWNGFAEMVAAIVVLTGFSMWLLSRYHRRRD